MPTDQRLESAVSPASSHTITHSQQDDANHPNVFIDPNDEDPLLHFRTRHEAHSPPREYRHKNQGELMSTAAREAADAGTLAGGMEQVRETALAIETLC